MKNPTPEQIRQKCKRVPNWEQLPAEEQARILQALNEINEGSERA